MPGHVYFFKGLGKGQYAKGQKLVFTSGKSLTVGYASAVSVADWNRDGKPDLVIGTIDGQVWFVPNESRDKKLQFGAKLAVMAGDDEVQVTGDAGPLVADWDGDGIPDLLVGSSDGSVVLYRGSGKTGVPTLGDEDTLIPPLPPDGDGEIKLERDPATGKLREPKLERPGIRTKLALYDWNGDGKLDLLVGDVVTTAGPEPELDARQMKEKEELEAKQQKVSEEMSLIYEVAHERAQSDAKDVEGEPDDEAVERLEEATNAIVSKNERYRALSQEGEAIWNKLKPFTAERDLHGFVWVYPRTADPAPPARAATSDATVLPPDTKEAILAFRVTAKESGKPLRSMMISVIPTAPREDDFSWRDSKRSKGTIHESLRPDEQGTVEFRVPAGVAFQAQALDKDQWAERGTQDVSALAAGERRELRFSIPTEDDVSYHGRVVRASDGQPIQGARIRTIAARRFYAGSGEASHEQWSVEKLGETTSDAEGRFHLALKSWKKLHVRIEADGFAPKLLVPGTGHDSLATAADVKLLNEATVRARVLDAAGKALPRVAVVIEAGGYEVVHAGEQGTDLVLSTDSVDLPAEEWKGESGADGACVIRGLLPTVPLTARLQRDGAMLRKDLARFELAPGEDRAMEWKIGSGCTLKGTALDQERKPVAGQRILLASPNDAVYFSPYEKDEIFATATTDDAGRFVFEDVPRGSWRLGPAARPYGKETADPSAVAPLCEKVEVGEGGSQEIVLHAWRGQYIGGTVLAPEGGRKARSLVTAETDAHEYLLGCTPKADGTFTLGPIGPGPLRLFAREFESCALSESVLAEPGAKDVVLRLREGGRIRATVVDAKTGATCAAEVTVASEAPSKIETGFVSGIFSPTMDDGTFEQLALEAGKYSLSARTRDGRFGILRGVEVTTAKDPERLKLPVSPGGKIRMIYEGKQPQIFVVMASQGVDLGVMGQVKAGSSKEEAAPVGTVVLKLYRDLKGEPRTKEVVVAEGKTTDVVLGDED
jgi:hypothetical protein